MKRRQTISLSTKPHQPIGASHKVTITAIAMEFRQHKVNQSFSIENILREDFPYRQRSKVENLPTIRKSRLERWVTIPCYQCYTVRYSLPRMYKAEGRLHRVKKEKEQILLEQEEKVNDHCPSCKDEAFHHYGGKHLKSQVNFEIYSGVSLLRLKK